MPLSGVCVSSVGSRPRAWSSYTNIRTKDVHGLTSMNSAEEISKYKENIDNYYSPTLSRRLLGYGYDLPEKSLKKDKKWSIGNLFRRKKKDDSESSSDDEPKKGFLGRKKKKSEKKKKVTKPVGTFDHVVLSRNSHLYTNGFHYEEPAIFSEPYRIPSKSLEVKVSDDTTSRSNSFLTVTDASGKKSKRGLTKVRAEARRTKLKHDSSSDEGSQRSVSSSKFRSDESLVQASRRSRAARTERYLKRHSRDGENPNSYLRLSKSDAENFSYQNSDESRSLSRSPLVTTITSQSSISGLSTIPPSHSSKVRVSNSTSNPSYKPPLSMNEYNHSIRKLTDLVDSRSLSCDANINKSEFRSRNLSLIEGRTNRQPPPPPPRDPKRLVTAQYYDNRPNTCYLDKAKSFSSSFQKISPLQGKKFSFNLNSRSTSEDFLPNKKVALLPRPASATPRQENYNYLTDKKPRSRKPIVIQNSEPKVLDFWKQKEQGPQMFTCETRVETQVFLPTEAEEIKRKSTNLEEALDELEAIYNSLRLGDEDLLERAEEREKESVKKMYPRGALSDSSFSYEPFDSIDSPRRKKILKKSQTIDRRTDDMAYRKLNRERNLTVNDKLLSNISYLSTSPVYGCESPTENKKGSKEPDVTLDDVVYRNVKFSNSLLKVIEPQPPFGIPIGPIAAAPNSDYLHAVPEKNKRSIFKPRKIPDLVTDDLAFRNLRKDSNKGPQLSPEDLKNNNDSKIDLSHLKKKRAVRSLSANIGSLINKDVLIRGLEKINNNNSLGDIADAMAIARQVLKEKENKISATRRAFLSDTDNENLAESRMNFLNSLKKGGTERRSPKESTPIPISPLEKNSSLEDLLTVLATEARETNERISNELMKFESPEPETSIEVKRKLSEIDAVSEQAKLCEKVLVGKVDIAETKPALEEVEQIDVPIESKANVILQKSEERVESDHDYENLQSDQELTLDVKLDDVKSTSPFEEHKAALIATFQQLKENVDADLKATGKHSRHRSRSRLPRWLRPHSSGNQSDPVTMSEGQDRSSERIARYKEKRRKELAAQFPGTHHDTGTRFGIGDGGSSSGSEGPRATRTSRLRAAAALETCGSPKSEHRITTTTICETNGISSRLERDKSSKRKSNLNRALNSEEVPSLDADDPKNRRRRRRFFPQEVLGQSKESNHEDPKSETALTASFISQSPTSSVTASPSTSSPRLCTPRKSELSIHMENARRGITPSYCEFGKGANIKTARKMTPPIKRDSLANIELDQSPSSDRRESLTRRPIRNLNKKMEELTALTKDTLARVERLANKNKENVERQHRRPSSSPIKIERRSSQPTSILKPNATPVSILKRKISQDDHKSDSGVATHTPPVTFSPNVVEPANTNRKTGILKKRRSLDESQVLRHRSCSPDVANKSDSKSILKGQRRSSLEELTRTQSPETLLHGILKRKTSKAEEDDSLSSPQSILKRRSGASSAGSTGSSPHVSITTAVILAAAGGAEMILETDPVKPILKKKSISEDYSFNENPDAPKPILKKKSSTDTDECEDRPKKPILKISRNSSERDSLERNEDSDGSVKPILKSDSVRPRLSFCGDSVEESGVKYRASRRSHTICAEFSSDSRRQFVKEEDREMKKARPLSVSELVMSFENSGAIPKKSSLKRISDRYRTQPVTPNEVEASLNLVQKSPEIGETKLPKSSSVSSPIYDHSINSLLDFTSSLENDSNLNSFLCLRNTSPDSGVCGKMSSDSAFQSLGDGLELDQEEEKVAEVVSVKKLEPKRLELQMKAIAQEAQKMKLNKTNVGIEKYRNRKAPSERSSVTRFSTQPVTFDEVQEAARLNKDVDAEEKEVDPSKLSLCEKIKLFRSPNNVIRELPRRRFNRFQTQPITSDEVDTARGISPSGLGSDVHHGILKSSPSPSHLRPVLKIRDSFDSATIGADRRSILKTDIADVTQDEGISCNDSASDSESVNATTSSLKSPEIIIDRTPVRNSGSSETSDGESSGGREVKKIFRNENKLKVKQKLESVLFKSKSQNHFVGDENCARPTRKKDSPSVRRSHTTNTMPKAIEELQAKLQQSGENGWRKRVQQNNNANDELRLLSMNRYNDELSEKSILKIRKDELDAASKQWKCRVEKSDAEEFSVAGRMEKNKEDANLPINIPTENKRTPQAKRFKGKDGNDSLSTPGSPDKNQHMELARSFSVPDPHNSSGSDTSRVVPEGKLVQVSRPDDFTFRNFYKNIDSKVISSEQVDVDVTLEDFDAVTRQSLLVQRKNVQIVQRRRGTCRNPVKALATRNDIFDEYNEVLTGVAEREKKRLNIEKLAKTSNLAETALAGLVSNEDFKKINLKKSSYTSSLNPYKETMLLQVKGRHNVQTRLVEPTPNSINEGDSYILITPTTIYSYSGKYSNVIEQSRASDIVNHIQSNGDMGVQDNAKIVNLDIANCQNRAFWDSLGVEKGEEEDFSSGGNPEEDAIFENNILATNMIYKLEDNELVPFEEYWGKIPKIEMLETTKVFVFDFGAEMYIWSGKNAPLEQKKLVFRLAKELWETGFDYSDCNISPLNVASILGKRDSTEVPKKSDTRPEWALFAKITQHRETILFKEKFLDWPDFTRVIRIRHETSKKTDASLNIKPIEVAQFIKPNDSPVDLVVENLHLGRGDQYFDEDTKRLFEFETLQLTVWNVLENYPKEIPMESVGHFYNSDSYIVKWNYRTTVKGRELSGKPSKHLQAGRDRCIYFCWQGSNSSINDKGSAALLTIELDLEKAPQVRVCQNQEPAVFLKIFKGNMIIHEGKRETCDIATSRLFVIRGELKDETCLVEVPCEKMQLRSRACFIAVESQRKVTKLMLWIGSKVSSQTRLVSRRLLRNLAKSRSVEFGFCDDVDVREVVEGEEDEEFWGVVGGGDDYVSLVGRDFDCDFTMRVFHLSSVSASFKAAEMLCPHRSEFSSPFPVCQSEIYSASQPALFLIDNNHELWLWQGWWPEREEEESELSDQTGSGAIRWQAERKAAMQTTLDYWQQKQKHSGDTPIPAFLVWAGLEPPEFKNLFFNWQDNEDVADLNLKDGKVRNEKKLVETQLALLSRSTYPLSELMQRPLPDGVDPTQLEVYLSSADFEELLSMSKEEFAKLPIWKQTSLKKEKGLF